MAIAFDRTCFFDRTFKHTSAAAMATPATTVTFGHEVTAHGFLGRLRQRGLAIAAVVGARSPTVALTAYTAAGPHAGARLEVPVADLRHLARILLDLADHADGSTLRPASVSLSDLADLRRAG
jgi:hypothetical protein